MPLLNAAAPATAPAAAAEPEGTSRESATAAEWALERVAAPNDDRFLARLRLRQQLLRLSCQDLADPAITAAEARAVVERIRRDQWGFQHWHDGPPGGAGLGDAGGGVSRVAEDVAGAVCERFHYIGTPREGTALGLFGAMRPAPATLLLLSRFDLGAHREALPAGVGPDNVLLLSRVYTFRWAPRNAFSFSWRRALPLVRQLFPEAALVLTYLDPNVGFSAASYLAANWLRFAADREAEYLYLDGRYVTRRELERRCGAAGPMALAALLGARLATARQPLAPQQLWAFPLRRALRRPLLARHATLAAAAAAR